MNNREYGERMRQRIIDLLKENEGERYSTSDIGIYFGIGFGSALKFLKQLKEQKLDGLKWEYGYKRVGLYWWDEEMDEVGKITKAVRRVVPKMLEDEK